MKRHSLVLYKTKLHHKEYDGIGFVKSINGNTVTLVDRIYTYGGGLTKFPCPMDYNINLLTPIHQSSESTDFLMKNYKDYVKTYPKHRITDDDLILQLFGVIKEKNMKIESNTGYSLEYI